MKPNTSNNENGTYFTQKEFDSALEFARKQGYTKALDDMNGKMTIYKGDPELDAIYNMGFKDALDDVEKILNRHREKAFITCREDCFCWKIEQEIARLSHISFADSNERGKGSVAGHVAQRPNGAKESK